MPLYGSCYSSSSFFTWAHKLSLFVMQSLFVVFIWLMLFYINAVIFEAFKVNQLVNWIFLPACVRLISVLIFEWAGVLGIFIGALITYHQIEIYQINSWVLALISCSSPFLTLIFCRFALKLPNSLIGLNTKQLLFIVILSAIVNTGLNYLYYQWINLPSSLFDYFIPMMMGDILGCLILFYILAFIIRMIKANFDGQ